MSASPDYVGQTCQVLVPYSPEFVERPAVDVDQIVARKAARRTDFVLPDDLLVQVHEATAVTL